MALNTHETKEIKGKLEIQDKPGMQEMQEMQEIINDIKNIMKNPINNKIFQVLKYSRNESDYIIHIDVNTIPIKIITDFNKYCFGETPIDELNINKFNLNMIFKLKTPENIFEELSNVGTMNIYTNKKLNYDPFHVNQKLEELTKFKIDYTKLQEQYFTLCGAKSVVSNGRVPKDLLLSSSQIYQLLINEIKKVNRNREYEHYIFPDENDPYTLIIRLKIFDEKDDYVEIKLIVDSKMYPFVPPKLEYVKPKIKLSLLISLINLNILTLSGWSPLITLEYFIINLANELKPIMH